MRRIISMMIFLALINGIAYSQSCLPGENKFYNQNQIDNFKFYNPGCSEIEGNVSIYNDYITNLDSLNVLTSIWGNLSIMWANSLKDLSGLDNIDSIGGDLNIGVLAGRRGGGNDSLINLDELNNLTSIGGSLYIGWNASLNSIEGLSNLTSLGGSVSIVSNDTLANLNGLENFTSLPGLSIEGNASLISLEGLGNLTSLGELSIQGNASLPDLKGLENLVSISESLRIGGIHYFPHGYHCVGNTSLLTLDGLDNLSTIGGHLSILCNDSLESLSAIESLTYVGGNIDIGFGDRWLNEHEFGNPLLISLSGLDNIEAGSIDSLFITDNDSLTDCKVQSICDYLVSPNGEVIIENNATGCNTPEQVDSACVYVTVQENPFELMSNVHPNPFNTSTTIEYTLSVPETFILTFYNQFGKLVDRIEQKQSAGKQQVVWTPENLADGIYYFRLQAGEQMASGKIVLIK